MIAANLGCRYIQEEAGKNLGTKTYLTIKDGEVARKFFLKFEEKFRGRTDVNRDMK